MLLEFKLLSFKSTVKTPTSSPSSVVDELLTNGLIGPPLGGLFSVSRWTCRSASMQPASRLRRSRWCCIAPSDGGGTDESLTHQSEGFRWFWRRPVLRNLALISTALGTASFIGAAVFVLFATQTLHLSATGYGLLLVPAAVGGIAGSLLAPKLTNSSLRLVLATSVTCSGIATSITSAISIPVLVGALAAISAAAVLTWNVLTLALRQRSVPDHLLGRVGASYRFLVYIGMPFGALAGGFLANAFGIRSALAVNGATFIAIGLSIPYLLRGVDDHAQSMPQVTG